MAVDWAQIRFAFCRISRNADQQDLDSKWLKDHGAGALREYRRRFGLTQKQLADQLGVSHTYLSHVESGRMTLSVLMAATLGRNI